MNPRRAIRRIAPAVLLLSLSAVAFADALSDALAARLEVVRKPALISLGFRDFDLLQPRFKALEAVVEFTDAQGRVVAAHRVDLQAPTARSHTLFRQPADNAYAGYHLVLRGDGKTVFEKTAALPPVVATAAYAGPLGEKTRLTPGVAPIDYDSVLAGLVLPDWSKAPEAAVPAADRTVDVATSFRRVRCDKNYPICGAANNSFMGRQTAAPDDPARKSMYISLRSQLFDPETAKYLLDAKSLAELQLTEDWLMPALQAEGDVAVSVPLARTRAHWTERKVKSRLGDTFVTGERIDGLMQIVNSVAQDDAGNLYFAADYRGCIRFNIRTAEFEPMPADIYAFLAPYLPKADDLPYPKDQVKGRSLDFATHIHHHNGRIYISLARDAIFGNNLCLAAVVSVPVTDWDAPEKFKAAMRFNAGSWPTARHPLFDTWVKPNEMTRKLLRMFAEGGRMYMLSYHNNYLWAMDLDAEGGTTGLTRLDTFEGKQITHFEFPKLLTNPPDGKPLGVRVEVTLAGETAPRTLFAPPGATAYTAEGPAKAAEHPFHYQTRGVIRGETQYGVTAFDKVWMARYLGWKPDGVKPGKVTLYYDALAAMEKERNRLGHILDRIKRWSLAPGYHIVSPPGETNRVLGVAEYGYYQAWFDTSKLDQGFVDKRFLKLDTGAEQTDLAVAIGIGAYSHTWLRHDEKLYLYYCGYTGITRLLYAEGGRPLDRFHMEPIYRKLAMTSADNSPAADIKWYQDLCPGLDGKLLVTGTHQANRGGSPYSNGLMWFDPVKLGELHQLSEMTRSHDTARLRTRLLLGPAGPVQEIVVTGNFDQQYALLLPPDRVPKDRAAKIFLYEDSPPAGVHDKYGLALGASDGQDVAVVELAFSPDQHFLVMQLSDKRNPGAVLATLDLQAGRVADAVRLSGGLLSFPRPTRRLLEMPDGRLMACLPEGQPAAALRFVEVKVDAAGKLSLAPILTLKGKAEDLFSSVLGFIPSGNGAYDLMIGASVDWNRLDTSVRVIPRFLPPRTAL